MKIHRASRLKCESGMVMTLMFVILLTIMMILVTAESRSLYVLHREVKLLEQQQVKRLDNAATNTTATVDSRLP
ncbi:MAG TPA: hypothetical protein VK742_02310 [Candidatus Sulfotelmatobacter sp.]|jgi:hypothetical protein|nr:hypothetical protein [Candidatus Sulfotelmatobacter sp.]